MFTYTDCSIYSPKCPCHGLTSDCTIYSPRYPYHGLTSDCNCAFFIRASKPKIHQDELASSSCHPSPLLSLPILALDLSITCPSLSLLVTHLCPSLPLSLFVLAQNSLIGHPDCPIQSPLGSVGQPGRPASRPQTSDLEFYSLANQASLPSCNPTDGCQDLGLPSLGGPPPQSPRL